MPGKLTVSRTVPTVVGGGGLALNLYHRVCHSGSSVLSCVWSGWRVFSSQRRKHNPHPCSLMSSLRMSLSIPSPVPSYLVGFGSSTALSRWLFLVALVSLCVAMPFWHLRCRLSTVVHCLVIHGSFFPDLQVFLQGMGSSLFVSQQWTGFGIVLQIITMRYSHLKTRVEELYLLTRLAIAPQYLRSWGINPLVTERVAALCQSKTWTLALGSHLNLSWLLIPVIKTPPWGVEEWIY